MANEVLGVLLRVLPRNLLSRWVGRLVHLRLPPLLARASVRWFVRRYRIDLEEAAEPVERYRSIGELFVRRLKPGARSVGEGVVHPADSSLTELGVIEHGSLVQAKGRSYTVSDLLQSEELGARFSGGSYATYYLCPRDYHRVHSPVDGEIVESRHIPGTLWPVNSWSVNRIDNLFAVNERVYCLLSVGGAEVAVVLVGATNVGSITLAHAPEITSNRPRLRSVTSIRHDPPVVVGRGEELGVFNMGSTVIVIFPPRFLTLHDSPPVGREVRMGGSLGRATMAGV